MTRTTRTVQARDIQLRKLFHGLRGFGGWFRSSMFNRTQRLLNVTTSMTRRASAQSATISEAVAIVVSPENAPCALTRERATTHPLERPSYGRFCAVHVWPVLKCPPRAQPPR